MKVYELLAEPTAWTQLCLAKDSEGKECQVKDPQAVSFCLLGSIEKCYSRDNPEALKVITDIQHRVRGSVQLWNDETNRTHAEVLALVKELGV